MTPQMPGTIGRYEIQECLDQGSMGIVSLAKDPSALQRRVAIKVLKVDDEDMRLRFESVTCGRVSTEIKIRV